MQRLINGVPSAYRTRCRSFFCNDGAGWSKIWQNTFKGPFWFRCFFLRHFFPKASLMLGFSFSWQLAWRASFGCCQRNEFERREVNIWYGRSRAGVTTEWERQLTVSDTVGWASMARNGSCNWYGWLASAGLAGECGGRHGKGARVVPGTAGDAAWRASAAQVDGRSMCMGSQHGWCRQWWRGGTGGASTVVDRCSAGSERGCRGSEHGWCRGSASLSQHPLQTSWAIENPKQ